MDDVGFGRGIKGAVMGDSNPQTFVPYLAALHAQGKLPYDRFVKFYDFADINQAIADSKSGEVIKTDINEWSAKLSRCHPVLGRCLV